MKTFNFRVNNSGSFWQQWVLTPTDRKTWLGRNRSPYAEDMQTMTWLHMKFLWVYVGSTEPQGKRELKSLLTSFNKSTFRGQTYDGATNMGGRFAGVQAVEKRHQPLALYEHHGTLVMPLCTVCNEPGCLRNQSAMFKAMFRANAGPEPNTALTPVSYSMDSFGQRHPLCAQAAWQYVVVRWLGQWSYKRINARDSPLELKKPLGWDTSSRTTSKSRCLWKAL